MQVPTGSERFTFPEALVATSPPSTPNSSRSSYYATPPPTYAEVVANKRYGYVAPLDSPPDNIAHVNGHNFSYAPSPRPTSSDTASDSTTDSDEISTKLDDILDIDNDHFEAPSPPPSHQQHPPPTNIHRSSITILSHESFEIDFTIEEITEDDISYDFDAEVLHPNHCEEASSNDGDQSASSSDSESGSESDHDNENTKEDKDFDTRSNASSSLTDTFGNLHCEVRDEVRKQREEFEEKQHQKYLRKKKRWSQGGMRKRDLAASVGSDSDDNEDIVPRAPQDDMNVVGVSARRLRRRTEGPDARPRGSLLFEDPPREIEELRYLETNQEDDGGVIDTDDELMLPDWMYPASNMEVDTKESSDEESDEDSSSSSSSDDDGD